jgi:maltose O-acetyltransferase
MPNYAGHKSMENRSKLVQTVWLGSGALILPGVRIGARTVIGAGSVVTRNLPDGVFAAGNLRRVIRQVSE